MLTRCNLKRIWLIRFSPLTVFDVIIHDQPAYEIAIGRTFYVLGRTDDEERMIMTNNHHSSRQAIITHLSRTYGVSQRALLRVLIYQIHDVQVY